MAGLEQSAILGLQQTLSPQMQQSLHILQVPAFELRTLVEQELQVNPVLEEEVTEKREETSLDQDGESGTDLEDTWDTYLVQGGGWQGERSEEAEAKHTFLMNSLVAPKSLQQSLLDQLGFLDLDGDEVEVAKVIIGNLNDDGYLEIGVEQLANLSNVQAEHVEIVLRKVQSLDPAGVAARDLRECLLIQLARMGREKGLEARIVDGHLEDLLRKKFPEIARKLGVSPHAVQEVADFLGTLEPRPARAFSNVPTQVLTADVVVERDGETWMVRLNQETVPMLRISNYYKDLLSEAGGPREVREYLREKIRGGRFFMRCIEQRQQTILQIAREIVARQEAFLEQGPAALTPMTMGQVADAIGIHETTVSRAVSNKAIQTPHGLFEMRYFFTVGYETDSGAAMSNEGVRKAILEVVNREDRRKPLSDQSIQEILREQGITVARRTIAKYREQLGILPSHLRKVF